MKSPIKDKAKAPHVMVNNVPLYLCCADCPAKLKKEPAKYVTSPVKDPVTGQPFKVTAKTPKIERGDAIFLFSSAQTRATFQQHPGKYVKPHGS
jgi:YHS domain-containing protein